MKRMIMLMLCLALGSFVLTGCSDSGEPFVQKEYTAQPSQIRGLTMDVRDRQIDVSISEDGQIHISYFENSKEGYQIGISDGKILTVTSAENKNWTDYIGGKPSLEHRKLSLRIPDALLENLTLSTTNEDISLPALAVTGSIRLSSNGGDIIFERLKVGKALALDAKNGNISGKLAGSYEEFSIQTQIKKGESNLPGNKEEGEKALTVSCNHGDVQIGFVSE